jgi:hypothetical protein
MLFMPFGLLAPKDLNHLIVSVPEEDYSRDASCA